MRLVTRSDFDGLICAALLKQVKQIDSIQFVHPKDLQDGKFEVTADDVLTNVPYVPGCGLWFDHHATEIERIVGRVEFQGDCWLAPSAARVVYDYYGGSARFPGIEDMMGEVDKADSALFTPLGLAPAVVRHGRPHGPGPVPGLPHLELSAYVRAD